MTRADIERINDLDKMIRQLERKREELRERRTNISAFLSDMPRSRSEADKMAEYVAELDEIDQEYLSTIAEHEQLYLRYVKAITSLRHLERQILKLRYESRYNWRKIAKYLHYSESRVKAIHYEALKKIAPF